MSETSAGPVSYDLDGPVAVIRLDDGKANAISHLVVDQVSAALDQASDAGASAVAIVGRPGRFSAGFDLATMQSSIGEARDLLRVGAELALRLYRSPVPVVAGVTGHALAMGAILLLSTDVRVGAEGDFKIGLNEVAIGMPVPSFATELARDRLSPTQLTRAVNLAGIYDPAGALAAGYLDEVVPADQVVEVAIERARALAEGLHASAFRATRDNLRGERADALLGDIHADIQRFTVEV